MTDCEPCPFCGSHDLAVNGHGAYTVVICCGCLSEGPHGPLSTAIRKWNTRTCATVDRCRGRIPLSPRRDAAIGLAASLAAAISLLEHGGKKAAPSDKMFDQMLDDYRGALARFRAADHDARVKEYHTVSLRDRIKHVIDCVEDQDDSVCMDAAADAILALVRAHLTSEEAVGRAAAAAYSLHNPPLSWITAPKWVADMYRNDARAALRVALGEVDWLLGWDNVQADYDAEGAEAKRQKGQEP